MSEHNDGEGTADRTQQPQQGGNQSNQETDERQQTQNPQQSQQGGQQKPGAGEKYCSSCGSIIKEKAEICPDCGVRQQGSAGTSGQQQKNPGVAALLSFFITGGGQIYNGQIGKGIGLIVLQVINVILMAFLIGLLTFPLVWIYGVWDAYDKAKKINDGEIEP